MKIAIYCFAYLSLIGCASKTASTKIESQTSHSIYQRDIIRDTIMTLEADTVSSGALLRCDSLGRVYMQELEQLKISKGHTLQASMSLKDNRLEFDCSQSPQYIRVRSTQTVRATGDTVYVSQKVHVYKQKPLGLWIRIQIYAGRFLALILFIAVIIKLIKR